MEVLKLHTKVLIKGGLEGVVIGTYQDRPNDEMSYLVRYWKKDGTKARDYFVAEELGVF